MSIRLSNYKKAPHSCRPQLEILEARIVPSQGLAAPAPPAGEFAAIPSVQGAPAATKEATGSVPASLQNQSLPPLLGALATQRGFIDYSPSGYPGNPFNPTLPNYPAQNDVSTAQISHDLQTLYNEGWRGIVTYSMQGNQQYIPQIAKQIGFTDVIVGISNATVAQWNSSTNAWNGGVPPQEYQNTINSSNLVYIDGIVVGNEGLTTGPITYSFGQLQGVMSQLRSDLQTTGYSNVLVTTTDEAYIYLPPSISPQSPLNQQQWLQFLQMSDWLFPTDVQWFNHPNDPSAAVTAAGDDYYGILYQIGLDAPQDFQKLLVFKESFWPNNVNGNDDQQVQYFSMLANAVVPPENPQILPATHIYFVWGEAYDQYWKNEGSGQGPHWGYNSTTASPTDFTTQPDPIVQPGSTGLQSLYTASYPTPPPNFASALQVTNNPNNQTVTAGGTATFMAAANGNPTPSVLWQVSTDGGKTFTNISGATSTTLTLNNVSFSQNGYEYQAVFTNRGGSITTTVATLTVQVPPTMLSGNSAVFTVGHGGSFIVTANGSPTPTLTESGALPSGVTFIDNGNGTASLGGTPAPGTAGTYHFTVTAHNGVGGSAPQSFTLTVNPPPPKVPPLLGLFDALFGGTVTINPNGTETITDSVFGIPLLVSTFDSSGNLVSVDLYGFINITLLFELF